jgi:hypothetical protein
MQRQNVESSNLLSIGYDPQASILEIEFVSNGEVWQYYDIPSNIFEELITADSKGRYFHRNIRGKYHDTRVG